MVDDWVMVVKGIRADSVIRQHGGYGYQSLLFGQIPYIVNMRFCFVNSSGRLFPVLRSELSDRVFKNNPSNIGVMMNMLLNGAGIRSN
jgi:hypothetical protein